jgi:hypothetical protein
MSCFSIRASCALLIGLEYILFDVVVCCLSIAQHASVWEQELLICPAGSALQSDRAEVQVEVECNLIKRSLILSSWTCWSLGIYWRNWPLPDCYARSCWFFRLRCSDLTKANPDDQVVVDGVPIGGRTGPSIEFIVAGCLMTAWNVFDESLRPRWNSKSVIVVRRSSYSWVVCSRSLPSTAMNDSVLDSNWMPVRNFSS